MKNILLIFTSIIMGAIGQILLKVGANKLGNINTSIEGLFSIIKNYYILVGLVLFGTSFLLWVKILTKNELSYVYPMVSVSYIIIILASKFLFNEPFTANKIIGIIAIISGVFIINK
jgi:drug/metabolite transporter (DMT)-like permease